VPPRVDLRAADLRGVNMAGQSLEGADLRAADLRGANFTGSNLRYADFRGADIRGGIFQNASLYAAKLQGADAREADFRNSDLRQANLGGAYLEGAMLPQPGRALPPDARTAENTPPPPHQQSNTQDRSRPAIPDAAGRARFQHRDPAKGRER